ncbi:DUF397 domain-containing protein [Embleya sp. NBC_00896]|uniref:DUF397 domain-containing protein n=1 Tax=Embleya sp. NBC_00896 TaxID=2975961 RepID=UPI00386EF949|nr:DUF397 domain-containing protein [Embleya sp. NBC_00896]
MNIDDAAWRTSTRSADYNECVEVAPGPRAITGIRDTKARRRGHVEIVPAAWVALLDALKR